MKAIKQYQGQIGKSRYLVLCYENLVANLVDVVNHLINFLQIEPSEILYIPTKGMGQSPWGGNAATGDKIYGVVQTQPKWLQVLDKSEVKQIESLLRDEMNFIGYKLTHDAVTLGVPLAMRLKNILRQWKFDIQHF